MGATISDGNGSRDADDAVKPAKFPASSHLLGSEPATPHGGSTFGTVDR